MPYQTGQDIGGFGRLAEAERWVAGQKREDIRLGMAQRQEEQRTRLAELQIKSTENNFNEVQRGKKFAAQYINAISSAPPAEHYNVGNDWLAKYAKANPDDADLVYKEMQNLDVQWSSTLDEVRKQNPDAAIKLFNNSIGKRMGVRAEGAGVDVEKGDLFALYDEKTNKPLGTYYNDPKTNEPKLYSTKLLTKQAEKEISGGIGKELTQGESDMRKEFSALPETKTYVEVAKQVDILSEAMDEVRQSVGQPAEKRNLIAVDQALITLFNKMMDPTSVVRESEYARTPGDMAMMSRAKGAMQKMSEGGAGLTDAEREAIYTMADKFAEVSGKKYAAQAEFYGRVADDYGYDKNRIIRIAPPVYGENITEEISKTMVVPFEGMRVEAALAPDGFYYIEKDGKFFKYIPEAE